MTAPARARARKPSSHPKCGAWSQDDRIRILLVDDQPGKLLSYEAMLGELDATLIRATLGGARRSSTLLKTEIAVVLIDVCMPEPRRLRARGDDPRPPALPEHRDHPGLGGARERRAPPQGLPRRRDGLRGRAGGAGDPAREGGGVRRSVPHKPPPRAHERRARAARRRSAPRSCVASDRRKDEFLAMLAHELRNPLAPMRNALHLLRAPADPGAAPRAWTSSTARSPPGAAGRRPARRRRITRARWSCAREPVSSSRRCEQAVEGMHARDQREGQQLVGRHARATPLRRRRRDAARAGLREPPEQRRPSTPSAAATSRCARARSGARGGGVGRDNGEGIDPRSRAASRPVLPGRPLARAPPRAASASGSRWCAPRRAARRVGRGAQRGPGAGSEFGCGCRSRLEEPASAAARTADASPRAAAPADPRRRRQPRQPREPRAAAAAPRQRGAHGARRRRRGGRGGGVPARRGRCSTSGCRA